MATASSSGSGQTRSLMFHLVSNLGGWGTNSWAILLCFSQAINRELEWKWSSWDTSRHPYALTHNKYTYVQCYRQWLYVLCHSTSTQFPEWPFTVAFHFSAWFFSSLISFLFLWFFLTVVQCQPLERPNKATMVCAHPLADFAYGSSCKFECQTGYRVRGSDTLYCTGSGQWTAPLPTCEGRICILEKRQGLPMSGRSPLGSDIGESGTGSGTMSFLICETELRIARCFYME